MYPPQGPRRRQSWRNTAPPMFVYQPPPPMPLYPPPPPPYGAGAPPPPPYPYDAVPSYQPYFGHHHLMLASATPAVVHAVKLQPVTAANFAEELDLIGGLLPTYPYVVVDAEYPGTVHHPPAGRRDGDLSPDERYALVKANVDELHIVQLGITICDAHGNLPFIPDDHGHGYGYGHYGGGGFPERAWEVEFSDFDAGRDRHAEQSVAFLRSQGFDFDAARARGVSSSAFGAKLAKVLTTSATRGNKFDLTWVAFGGAYDLAYLVKMLDGGQPLPETREGFVARVRELLGGRVFDAKFMAENCGRADLRGVGLRSVAANLGAAMPAADLQPWLAGTKSVTAYRIHTILKLHVLSEDAAASFEGVVDGLQ